MHLMTDPPRPVSPQEVEALAVTSPWPPTVRALMGGAVVDFGTPPPVYVAYCDAVAYGCRLAPRVLSSVEEVSSWVAWTRAKCSDRRWRKHRFASVTTDKEYRNGSR